MGEKRKFSDLFNDPSPAINVKFSNTADEKSKKISIKHSVGPLIDKKGRKYLESICKDARLNDFFEFYMANDGFDFCVPIYPDDYLKIPALTLIPSSRIGDFTKQYGKGGEWAWIIDLNKSKPLYRGEDTWVVFARIEKGPSALCIFLTGENTGSVYFITPQPHFNILKPIAKSFTLLLERIAKDPAAFLRLVRSYITKRGADGQNYGFVAVEYIGDSNKLIP